MKKEKNSQKKIYWYFPKCIKEGNLYDLIKNYTKNFNSIYRPPALNELGWNTAGQVK